MALDKQRILNELGSVVNQLQSADCGCMGKLFSQGQQNPTTGYPMANCGGYRHGCCHSYGHNYGHSHNSPCAGEPCNAMNANPIAMGRCNPPKLYADTYNYLNQNLMQPVVKDVYNDLKNLTPANTISNNPMAAQMGLSAQGNSGNNMAGGMNYPGQDYAGTAMAGGAMGGNTMQNTPNTATGYQMMGNQMAGYQMADNQMAAKQMTGNQMTGNQMMGNQMEGNQMTGNQMTGNQMTGNQMTGNQMMGNLAGMGPQIVNMMTGDGKSRPANMEGQAQGGSLTGPMVIDSPNSPHGQVGVTPLNQPHNFNQSQFTHPIDGPYAAQGYSNLKPQNLTPQSMYGGDTKFNNAQMNQMLPNMAQNDPNAQMGNSNPAAQQMAAAHRNPHGIHAQGVAKFNEMFPGVMQGLGGDLGFDPMAIAIQMNPANQQRTAVETMQKLMNGNRGLDSVNNSALMQPVMNGMKAAAANLAPTQQAPGQTPSTVSQQMAPNQQNLAQEMVPAQNQQAYQNVVPNQPQQQIYTAVPGNTALNAQGLNQQYQQIPQQDMSLAPQGQQITDPRYTSVPPSVTQIVEGSEPAQLQNPGQNSMAPHTMIREPIFPVDRSKNLPSSYMKQKYFDYNTLGQPVQMLPAKMFHSEEPNLPQTLSPQSPTSRRKNDYMKYSNVKSTVSKTSLMADRPVGKVPSRSQLQQVYNQYKGSQSFTQQSIKETAQPVSHSEARIARNQVNTARQQPQAPVEQVGDVAVHNPPPNAILQKAGEVIGHIGDVPAEKPPMQGEPNQPLPQNGKLRNGLQDMVYTSYPSSAWSFHGHNQTPYYPTHRNRRRL